MPHHRRRLLVGASATALLLAAGCAGVLPGRLAEERPPIVFVHGNGDSAALWLTTLWRFESNGWPRERLHAIDMPYPLARDDDTRPQAGRSSTAEHMAYLQAEVDKVLAATGARQVVLLGNSRGANAIRNYIANGGGDRTVSHAVLGGGTNHGVWALPIPGLSDQSEFAGHGAFLTALNRPRNAAGDEVTGPVKWMTIRSDRLDKFAQPDGLWIGRRGVATGVTAAGPELKGATNVVIPDLDHRESSFAPAAFEAAYRFITGQAPRTLQVQPEDRPVLSGRITGLGLDSTDPRSGNFANNLPLPGARLTVYETDPATGERLGPPVYDRTTDASGAWGPLQAKPQARYEFVLAAPGYATTHTYRGPFPRSSSVVHLRGERIADADKDAAALVVLTRPRGYFDPVRDRVSLMGQPAPGIPPGAGVASSRLKLADASPRTVVGRFNAEELAGRTWPAAQGHLTVLELHD